MKGGGFVVRRVGWVVVLCCVGVAVVVCVVWCVVLYRLKHFDGWRMLTNSDVVLVLVLVLMCVCVVVVCCVLVLVFDCEIASFRAAGCILDTVMSR